MPTASGLITLAQVSIFVGSELALTASLAPDAMADIVFANRLVVRSIEEGSGFLFLSAAEHARCLCRMGRDGVHQRW